MDIGFNQIGECLAGRGLPNGIAQLADFGEGHPFLKEGIFVPLPDGVSARFDAQGLNDFISHRLGNNWTHPMSNVCRLGEVRGRMLYYVDVPKRNFFSTHKEKASVILGSNDAEVPDWWGGVAVLLSELFYIGRENKICVAQDVYSKLLPPVRGRRGDVGAHAAVRHERRNEWLQYLLWLLAPLKKDVNHRVKRPSFGQAMAFFRKSFPGMPKSERTYRRDIDEMTGAKAAASKFDKRDELVSRVWKHLEDTVYILEAKVIDEIVEELGKIIADRGEGASMGVMPNYAWQQVPGENRRELTAYVE